MESSLVDPNTWKPKRTHEECEKILTAPGSAFEIETKVVEGRLLRVYKHLPPSLRDFWLATSTKFAPREYIVFENERITYGGMHRRASRAADVLRTNYNVRKGDRIAIVMRNFPEWIVVWWAGQLLGAVPVCVNAWLPAKTMQFCILHTDCKVVVMDPERAVSLGKARWLEGVIADPECCVNAALVVRHWEAPRVECKSVKRWDEVMASYHGPTECWRKEPSSGPEDNAAILFTSGTTGLPKGVLSTHRSFITNTPSCMTGRIRAMLRNGFDVPQEPAPNDPQMVALLSTPLFHVTGVTTNLMLGTVAGARLCLLRKWDREEAAKLVLKEGVKSIAGVPFTAMDLGESSMADDTSTQTVQNWMVGGAPSPANIVVELSRKFPGVMFSQGYGLTETNSLAASVGGPDFVLRPTSTGRPAPVNDILIVDPHTATVVQQGQLGEVWIRGPNIMKGYWKNPEATAQAITKDGWFKTGDLGSVDSEGFLYIRDRLKDIIIRGGENIDSTTVENAIYSDPRIMDCAAVGVPDTKLGELPAVVVTVKSAFRGNKVTEKELIALAREHLPPFAVPVMVLVQDQPIDRNAAGKVVKKELRVLAKKEWERRRKSTNGALARL